VRGRDRDREAKGLMQGMIRETDRQADRQGSVGERKKKQKSEGG